MELIKNMVSIIMPAYMAEQYIELSIQSVIEQTYQNWELIIVHDGSPDNTISIIRTYCNAYPTNIILIDKKKNEGTVKALNSALRIIRGEYICWLSADDLYDPSMLQESVTFLKMHKEYDAVFSKHEFINKYGEFLKEWDAKKLIFELEKKTSCEPYKFMLDIGNPFCFSTLLCRSYCYDLTGQFDEKYRYAHDYQYTLRLAAQFQIGFMNRVVQKTRIHENQITNQGNNELDAINAFVDTVVVNQTIGKKLLMKAGYDTETGLDKCLNNKVFFFALDNKILRKIKEYTKNNELRKKIDYLLYDFKAPIGFFQDSGPKSYLYDVCKSKKLDAFIINQNGIRFDRFSGTELEKFRNGLERNNEICFYSVDFNTYKNIKELVQMDHYRYFFEEKEKKQYRVGISKYLLFQNEWRSLIEQGEKIANNEKIWDILLEILMEKEISYERKSYNLGNRFKRGKEIM